MRRRCNSAAGEGMPMDASTYTFDSTAEIRLRNVLGIPRLSTAMIRLRGPTTVYRAASTAPAAGRFQAETELKEMNLHGKLFGVDIRVTLNDQRSSKGEISGRSDPGSPDPASPEPIGALRSTFDVYMNVAMPFGTLVNNDPIGMRAQIKSVPPDWAKYRQYTPPRSLFDKIVGMMIAEALHASHVVKIKVPQPGPGPAG
jgi:hypothetical protein